MLKTKILIKLVNFLAFYFCLNFTMHAQPGKRVLSQEPQLQKLVFKKDIKRSETNNSLAKNIFYIAFNYDYEDSVLVIVDDSVIYRGRLEYRKIDSNITSFPYNRLLLKGTRRRKEPVCHIFFYEAWKEVVFSLKKGVLFYDLEILENHSTWYLTLLNTYPWPD